MEHIPVHGQGPTSAQGGERAVPERGRTHRFVLMPHRSLTSRGFVILMGLFGGLCFLTGLAFMWVGAWPVMGFMGLDVLLLYVAFKVNYRAGQLRETLEISPQTMRVERLHPSGRQEAFEVNPYWAQVHLATAIDGRTALAVGSHGQSIAIGTFLTDDERRDLAQALKTVLADVRQPASE
jgi:uncharacterized membrane protein